MELAVVCDAVVLLTVKGPSDTTEVVRVNPCCPPTLLLLLVLLSAADEPDTVGPLDDTATWV